MRELVFYPSLQAVSMQQSRAVPVLCSITLFSLYCLLRFAPDLDLRVLFSSYLTLVGGVAVASHLADPLKAALPKETNDRLSVTLSIMCMAVCPALFASYLTLVGGVAVASHLADPLKAALPKEMNDRLSVTLVGFCAVWLCVLLFSSYLTLVGGVAVASHLADPLRAALPKEINERLSVTLGVCASVVVQLRWDGCVADVLCGGGLSHLADPLKVALPKEINDPPVGLP
ncbi:unnamed protein product [Closterium sp. Naga37s-1]|nr:unnamed protein product [Closterium sp. Naga37s-1]